MTLDLEVPVGPRPTGTVAALVRALAHTHPDHIALLAPGRAGMRYRELWAQALALAPAWRTLSSSGPPRIALALPNGPEVAAAWIAIACSATCVPLDPSARPAELHALLAGTGVQAVLLEAQTPSSARTVAAELGLATIEVALDPTRPAGTLEWVSAAQWPRSELPQRRPDDVALVVRTSGTTGAPKLVELSQAQVLACARDLARHFQLTPADCCLNARPMFHVAGLVVNVLSTLASGGRVLCVTMHDPDVFFDAVARYEPTWFSGVPTMHQWLLSHAQTYRRRAPKHRFRFVRSAAAALSPATLHKLEALTGSPVIETYGMSERTPIAGNPMPPGLRKPGTVGLAIGVELKLLDSQGSCVARGEEGEVTIRGPVAGVAEGEWFRTGDLGRLDGDGYLCLTGRVKDLINRGGQKLLPREIEDALLEHPGVAQAAVFRVAHPTLGEDVAAAVVAAARQAPLPAELRAFLLSRLAPYKVPSSFTIVDALPLGATGKVRRDALAALLAAQTPPPELEFIGETERRVAAIFRELLPATEVPRHDSFFALGGDSLAGARVIARIGRALGLTMTVDTLFRYPSVAELSREVDRLLAEQACLAAQIDALSDAEVADLLAREEAAGAEALCHAQALMERNEAWANHCPRTER